MSDTRKREMKRDVSLRDRFTGSRLIIPRYGSIRENLFQAAHDCLGHFGFDKSYGALRESFYWPNMRKDLETVYIPSCDECQRLKSSTHNKRGPLHPLPVPDARFTSVTLDFVGPLPLDEGFDFLLTMTDRMGADIQLVPCNKTITTPQLARIFFDHWYCENGLPDEIISDRDKLFTTEFWKTLHDLIGVKLKLSTSYHPQTNGASERTNKTVVQALRFWVDRNQNGWVKALPRVRFALMNTVNRSTGFSPSQLKTGRAPRMIPPFVRGVPTTPMDDKDVTNFAHSLINGLESDVSEAQDNLYLAKLVYASSYNKHRLDNFHPDVGDWVLLSTKHRNNEYKRAKDGRCAKFLPRRDGPYEIVRAHKEFDVYELALPDYMKCFATFHISELEPYHANDDEMFPGRAKIIPEPIINKDGDKEFYIEKILDERPTRHGKQYLVRFKGMGRAGDEWLPDKELEECEALDVWEQRAKVTAVGSALPETTNLSPLLQAIVTLISAIPASSTIPIPSAISHTPSFAPSLAHPHADCIDSSSSHVRDR